MSQPPQPPKRMKFMPTAATFQLREQLGTGTVGAVFRAVSPEIDEPVAVKILHPAVAHDPQIVERFQREIGIMERLDHPHIVRHFGGGMMDGQYYYAMQLLDRGSLKDQLVQHGRLPWAQAAAYGAQIASALQHAHNYGIVHRDLKPSNLFFSADGRLVLGDFGIARDTHDADISGDGITVGTYAYMSPEQINADGQVSGQADLYSLGCVLYEMIAGEPPFRGANFAQIWDQHLSATPTSFAERGVECPAWLEDLIIRQLLAKDAADRPFNARAVQGLLRDRLEDEFGDDADELTSQLPTLEPVGPRVRPLRVVAALVLLAVVIVFLIWREQ